MASKLRSNFGLLPTKYHFAEKLRIRQLIMSIEFLSFTKGKLTINYPSTVLLKNDTDGIDRIAAISKNFAKALQTFVLGDVLAIFQQYFVWLKT